LLKKDVTVHPDCPQTAKSQRRTPMFRVLAITITLAIACPVAQAMAQDGMLRALANRWKSQQDQQRKIEKDFNRIEREAARAFSSEPSTPAAKVKSGKGSRN
jgi:hypothetical protein